VAFHVDFAVAQGLGGRANQEDFCAVVAGGRSIDSDMEPASGRTETGLTAVLCDGMGGHNAGEVASKLAATIFLEYAAPPKASPAATSDAGLVDACIQANRAIGDRIAGNPSLDGMGTTLLGIRVSRSGLTWVSVGDSALYLYRDGELMQLNADHSMRPIIAQMVTKGMMTAEEAANHPDRNALRSALSGDPLSLIDDGTMPMNLKKGDVILTASDGIETLSALSLRRFLKPRFFWRPARAARLIVSACLKAGGKTQDNTTIILMKIG